MADKFHFIQGGAERYLFELKKILESNGHQVIPFAMKHPKNFSSSYSDYFVDYINLDPKTIKEKITTSIRSIGRILYSRHAQNRIQALIEDTRPDIAHLHMIDHQISPSILPVLKRAEIPILQTVHTYKHVCPSYRLYIMHKGNICEKCIEGNFSHAVFEKCHKASVGASLLLTLEMYLHRWLKLYHNNIDIFHVPSQFMGKTLIRGGIDVSKVHHLFYTINVDEFPFSQKYDDYFVYYGRLSEEKGLRTLLKAMQSVKRSHLKVIGEGPQRKSLEEDVRRMDLTKCVRFVGKVDGNELLKIVSNAKFVVVPSEWYENSPLVIYEAFSMGKPVIGARIGGIPELIDHGVDGYLFEATNHEELSFWINQLLDNTTLLPRFGSSAREKAETLFDPKNHYYKLMDLYERIMKKESLRIPVYESVRG